MYGHLWGGARKRWAKGKWAGFSSIHETPKRRELACMGIYEEVHGKDELKESGQDSASYMRHPKEQSLHVSVHLWGDARKRRLARSLRNFYGISTEFLRSFIGVHTWPNWRRETLKEKEHKRTVEADIGLCGVSQGTAPWHLYGDPRKEEMCKEKEARCGLIHGAFKRREPSCMGMHWKKRCTRKTRRRGTRAQSVDLKHA